jgi:hypothetical protein
MCDAWEIAYHNTAAPLSPALSRQFSTGSNSGSSGGATGKFARARRLAIILICFSYVIILFTIMLHLKFNTANAERVLLLGTQRK